MTDAPEVFRAMAETGTTQAKEAYEKMSATTSEATDLIRKSCSTAVEGVKVYNDKLLEFAQTNSKIVFDFAQQLLATKSPSEFLERSTEHARKQFEILTEQTKELAALGQKVSSRPRSPSRPVSPRRFATPPKVAVYVRVVRSPEFSPGLQHPARIYSLYRPDKAARHPPTPQPLG